MKRSFYFLLLIFLLSACAGESPKSNTVDVKTIYQKHKVNYSEGGTLFLESEFATNAKWNRLETEKSGDHIELTSPSLILFNGKSMNKDHSVFTGTMYTLQEKNLPSELTWEWTDNSGKKYINTARINPIKLKGINTTFRDQDMIIKWEGLPVQEFEEVLVSIKGEINGKDESSVKSTSKVGDETISFSYELLKQYRGQSVIVDISRKATIPVQQGTDAGGHILLNYDGGSITTSVTDRLGGF